MKYGYSFKYDGKEYRLDESIVELGGGVSVTVKTEEYPEYDAIEWTLYFENESGENSKVFSEISDSDILLSLPIPTPKRQGYRPTEGDACVITMTGMIEGGLYWENDRISATEYNLNYEYLDKAPNKTKRFANTGARSSEGMMPFFDVTAGGEGYIAAIGWTGDWKSEFSAEADGIRMKTGMKYTNFYLESGEKVRTTRTLIMKYTAGEDKYNKFRRLIKNHLSHMANTPATQPSLFASELWGGLTSCEMKKRLREMHSHGIKIEDIWIDAGWYGNCTKCDDAFSGDWWGNTGNWFANKRVHPNELSDVAECAEEMGARLMLWLEPERAIKGTEVIEKHPEWFITFPDSGNTILNYGVKEAREHTKKLLVDTMRTLNCSCYRQDFNTRLDIFFERADTEDRRGIAEIKHITGMYEVWDYLLESVPGIIIDNCAGGGRRIDIETLSRSIPFFRSDYQCNFNENPEVLQTHNSNISLYLPYNGCTSKSKGDIYTARSAYSSSFGIACYNAIFQAMGEDDFKWLKDVTDEYLSIRRYFSCDFYNHASSVFDESAWCVWQYHDADTNAGIVMAFRRCKSPFDNLTVRLKGLSDGEYTVRNLNDESVHTITDTLKISLPEKRSSVIFEYKSK